MAFETDEGVLFIEVSFIQRCPHREVPLYVILFPAEPKYVAISHTHVIVASSSAVYIWHYRTASRLAVAELTHLSRKGWDGQER